MKITIMMNNLLTHYKLIIDSHAILFTDAESHSYFYSCDNHLQN